MSIAYKLSAAIAAATLLTWLSLGHPHRALIVSVYDLYRVGAVTQTSLAAGQWWRLVTSQFLHVYLLHGLFSAVAIGIVGTALERRTGARGFGVACLIPGCMGQLVAVALLPTVPASGASQAAMGVAGAWLAVTPRKQWSTGTIAALCYVAATLTLDVVASGLPKAPHAIALACGWLIGMASLREPT